MTLDLSFVNAIARGKLEAQQKRDEERARKEVERRDTEAEIASRQAKASWWVVNEFPAILTKLVANEERTYVCDDLYRKDALIAAGFTLTRSEYVPADSRYNDGYGPTDAFTRYYISWFL